MAYAFPEISSKIPALEATVLRTIEIPTAIVGFYISMAFSVQKPSSISTD
jgi:hypothetical protein